MAKLRWILKLFIRGRIVQMVPRYAIVLLTSCMAVFLGNNSLDEGACAKEMTSYVSLGGFELGQLAGLGQSDLSLEFFLKKNLLRWDDSEVTGKRLADSQLTPNLLLMEPSANLIIGNIVSLDMKLGYGDFRMEAERSQTGNESTVAEAVPQWRWFSSISLNSYHQVRGIDLHGRIGFNRFVMEESIDFRPPNSRTPSLIYSSSGQQQIDARLGLTLGRMEPFLGGIYAYRSTRSALVGGMKRQNRKLNDGASLGLSGGFRFAIGEMSGGIVGSRRLRDSGKGSNSLEGNIRIKF